MNRFNHFFASLVACGLLIITTGCNKDVQKPEPQSPAQTMPTAEVQTEYPKEDYKDPALWKMPRLQYTTSVPDDFYVIRSINIDGTEPRFVLSFGDKSLPDSVPSHTPSRSPNRRYLATTVHGVSTYYRALTDLETGETTVLSDDATGNPAFNWTKDSNKLYYRADLKIWEYTLSTKTTRLVSKDLYGTYVFIIDNDQTLLTIADNKYRTYDIATGKETSEKELPWPDLEVSGAALSPNHKIAYIRESSGYKRIVDLEKRENIWRYNYKELRQNKIPKILSPVSFLDDNHIIYQSIYNDQDVIVTHNIKTLTSEQSLPIPDGFHTSTLLPLNQ